jgi:hypothetical protein
MTTPSDPQGPGENPVPSTPDPTPEEAAAAQAAADLAAAQAAQADAVRALATELFTQLAKDADYCTIKKGTVASIQSTATPPTLTITLSGSTTEIPGVRYVDSYAPVAGDTVDVLWQASSVLVLGQVAANFAESTWTTAPLVNGNSHNGNGNGNFQMRRVWDHGAWRVDLQGGINYAGNNICNAIDAKYRPVNATRRTLSCSRDANGSNVVKVDFGADGTVTMVGGTTAPFSATPNDSTHSHGQHEHGIDNSTHNHGNHEHGIPAVNAGLSEHNHSGAVSTVGHQHPTHDHSGTTNVETPNDSSHSHSGTTQMTTPNDSTHNHGGHSHDVSDPAWISFNGLHFYL